MPMPFFSLLDERRPTMSVGLDVEQCGGTSKSMRLKHSVMSGFFLIRSIRASSSGSVSTLSLMTVDMSTSPRYLSGVRFSEMMSGGWIGS